MISLKQKVKSDIQKKETEFKNKKILEFLNTIIKDAQTNLIIGGHIKSKELLDSFFIKQVDDTTWRVGNKAKYAIFLEKGTKPHPIDAINAPNLVFETKTYQPRNNKIEVLIKKGILDAPVIGRDGGFLKITKHVDHPGISAEWYLKRAIEDNIKKIKKKD